MHSCKPSILLSSTLTLQTDALLSVLFLTTVDALYEKVQKRTFIVTLIMVLAHIPFVIEIIVLYSKLGPRTDLDNEPKYSKLEQEESKLDNVDD